MSSKPSRGPSAAWRFSLPATLAFAVGTGVALLLAYLSVARAIRHRSDLWLVGEANTLTEVLRAAAPGAGQQAAVAEVADLARREIAPRGTDDDGRGSVFFLVQRPHGDPAVWVGPDARNEVVEALRGNDEPHGVPFTLKVAGYDEPFRVTASGTPDGGHVFLGLIDREARETLRDLAATFVWLWGAMLVLGVVVARRSAQGILRRVDAVTQSVAELGTEDLARRIADDPRRRDEISRLVATFNQMLERIERGIRSMRALADALAHDLKSPLTGIRGNLELAASAPADAPLRDEIVRAIEQVDRLLRTLETSLDATEAEAGALRLRHEALDLAAFSGALVELYRPAAEECGLELDVRSSGDTRLSADPQLLGRALGNLLDNALAHLPAGCRATVSVRGTADAVHLAIEDDGPGFPADVRERAFERFAKGSGSMGHGLGLAIVGAAAHAHGGSVILADRDGGGSRIELTLPRA